MKSLRIIIGGLNVGGTEKHLATLLPILSQRGWKIRLITMETSKCSPLLPIFLENNVIVQSPSDFFLLSYMPKFLSRIFRLSANIIRLWWDFKKDKKTITHFFLPQAYLIGMTAAILARLRAPLIMSRRSMNDYQKKRPITRWLELKYHQKVNYILGNSQSVVNQLIKQENVSAHKVRLIYNGVNFAAHEKSDQRAVMRKKLGIDDNTIVFIKIANLIPYKGHGDVIRAFGLIRKELSKKWRLLCVGRDDGILDDLKKLAQEYHVEPNLSWLGSCKDIPELLAAADVGLLCSHEEGFSNAVLESMAAGLPMIVTDVGGNAEAVLHGETGMIVPPKNATALSQAIYQLAESPSLMRSMGQLGKERVQMHFSLEHCAIHYQKLYSDICKTSICAA